MKTELLYQSKGAPKWYRAGCIILMPLSLLLSLFGFGAHQIAKQSYSYQIDGLYISTGNTGGGMLFLGWFGAIFFVILFVILLSNNHSLLMVYSDHIEGCGKVGTLKNQPFRYQIAEIQSVSKVTINLMVTLQNNTTCTVVCQDAQKACQILQQLLITAQTPAQQ